tara:strand:+ start:32 stop:484 length:453 start_codon:yes stop_codon:yes gene_type:complete
MRRELVYTMPWKTVTFKQEKFKKSTSNWVSRMLDINWYSIEDLYTIERFKIKHSKTPKTKWIKLPCVYKIKIDNKIVHVGRSDTCKKHGGAEKVRKALVNLLGLWEYNPSVTKTKIWEKIRLQHRPNSSNIRIGIIKTNAIKKTYLQEAI